VTDELDPGDPPPSTFEVHLSAEQLAVFRRDGFTHVERITTDEELEWLGPIYDRLFEGEGAFRGGYFDLARPYDSAGEDLVPQVLFPEQRFPQLRSTTVLRNATAIASQLLERPVEAIQSWGHMILKPPRVGSELPWHQDEAYWDPGMRYLAVGCWVPLDPATVESGCMHFVPGSHHAEVRPHRHIGDDPNVHGLVTDGVDDSLGLAVPLAPGGATFHHCRTLHRTTPNVSDRPRRAWANELQVEPEATSDPDDRPWVTEFKEAWDRRSVYR
jgi:ectoine hydroxylase-related dioxygenase (phytanoyl-CoA dioxygenase family)